MIWLGPNYAWSVKVQSYRKKAYLEWLDESLRVLDLNWKAVDVKDGRPVFARR